MPFAPTPFRVTFHLRVGCVDVARELPVEYRHVEDLYFGDKRMELNVVPAFSVRTTPAWRCSGRRRDHEAVTREMFVAVTNGTKGAANATVAMRCRRDGA